MFFEKTFIPYDGYWSTPFCRWQGNFAHLHSMVFAAEICKGAFPARRISPKIFDGIVLGMTVPQKSSFYGAPWMAAMVGATGLTGPSISQACATSAKCVNVAAEGIEMDDNEAILVVTCDRTSNGPHIYYPNPLGVGGTGDKEDWVWDNFGYDPWAKNAMIETAENVAKEAGISKKEQDEVALIRYIQYQDALKDKKGINRYATCYLPMDESLTRTVIDVSGRSYHVFQGTFKTENVGQFPTEMVIHFFQSFSTAAKITLHQEILYGDNDHHKIESLFKGFARAIYQAISKRDGFEALPSTKGML